MVGKAVVGGRWPDPHPMLPLCLPLMATCLPYPDPLLPPVAPLLWLQGSQQWWPQPWPQPCPPRLCQAEAAAVLGQAKSGSGQEWSQSRREEAGWAGICEAGCMVSPMVPLSCTLHVFSVLPWLCTPSFAAQVILAQYRKWHGYGFIQGLEPVLESKVRISPIHVDWREVKLVLGSSKYST